MIEKLDVVIDRCWEACLMDGPARPADVFDLVVAEYPETAEFYRSQMFRDGMIRRIAKRAKATMLLASTSHPSLFDLLPGAIVQQAIPISSGSDAARVSIEQATREHLEAWLGVERANVASAVAKLEDTEGKVGFLLSIMRSTDTVLAALARYSAPPPPGAGPNEVVVP